MSRSELEDFRISGRGALSESNVSCNRAKKAALSNPEDRVADEEIVKSPFALPDELVAKVLGHLPLQDRFRLETVCRQWKRCIYLEVEELYLELCHEGNQKYTLRINYVESDWEPITRSWTDELPAALHKLRKSKFNYLRYDIDDAISDKELLVLLADIASHATKVVAAYRIRYHPTNLFTFCDIIGPHVTSFKLILCRWRGLPEDIPTFADSFARMKRLKKLGGNWLDLIFACLNSFPTNTLPQFHEMKADFDHEYDWNLWNQFKSIYGAQLKKITLYNSDWLGYQCETLLPWKDTAPFANLVHLNFVFRPRVCPLTDLAKDLEATARSCPLLKSLCMKHSAEILERCVVSLMEVQTFFVAIGKMKMLEKLDFKLGFDMKDLVESSTGRNLHLFALLENKCNITHLKADVRLYRDSSSTKVIRRGIYGSLNNAMPKLRHLKIYCIASDLDHFVGLERMQTFHLTYFYSKKASKAIQDSMICILKSSPALRGIKFRLKASEVSEALIGAIMEVAKNRMEKHMDFIAKGELRNESPKAWKAMKHLAPRNLRLTFADEYHSDLE